MQASDSSKKHLGIGSVYLPPDCVDDVWKDSPFPLRTRHYHIFFVTGNPGCIEYYHDFLAILSHSLSKAFSSGRVKNQFHVYGHSLANFVHDAGFSSTRPRPILSLREQINFVEENLRAYVQDHKRDEEHTVDKQSKGECNVILVGHSVGTYISLEILSKLKTGRFSVEALQLVGLIALFPTITWIARSPSGLKLGRLVQVSFIAKLAGTTSCYLTRIMSRQVLERVVKIITGFPDNAAKTTANFLCSPQGVEQALYMAGDEMREITDDRWDQSIWGAVEQPFGKPPPKLFFFFGENDHWVANHTRDELIAARGYQGNEAESWKPKMMIDQEGIPHSFCIRHNAAVAAKVVEYIQEMLIA